MFPQQLLNKALIHISIAVLLFCLLEAGFAQPLPTSGELRVKNLQEKLLKAKTSPLKDIAFRNIGPSVMSGRVVDLEVNPNDPVEFYVAYATGGLWHTTNNGQSFTPVFDNEAVIGIGDIAVNWKDRTLWVGTGEVNSSRSSYAGIGVYKSSDNGKSWEYMGLPESHHIGKILLHPTKPNTAWVAVLGHLYSGNRERGVYKTQDGGKTWKQTLYIDEHTGAVELEINPQNPNELYAAAWHRVRKAWDFTESGTSSGIYKSTDGGEKWTLVSSTGSGFPQGEGVGRIGLAVYPNNPKIVYAVVDNYNLNPDSLKVDTSKNKMPQEEGAGPSANQIFGCEVYKSTDAGKHWKKTHEKIINIYNTYGYYFGKIFVSPTNADKIVITGINAMLSSDGGKTFSSMDKANTHSDWHVVWFNPKKDLHMVAGNDGGCNITYDDGQHWFKANTPSVGQFYAINVDNEKPYNVYGGLQDNGTWFGPSTNKESIDWTDNGQYPFKMIGGGDGMQVMIDPRDHNVVYTGFQYGVYSRINKQGGARKFLRTPAPAAGEPKTRFNWQTPILLSKHNPDIFYIGGNTLFRSMNKGDEFERISSDLSLGKKAGDVPFATLTTLSESPFKFGLIYAGTDDGVVSLTKDGGNSWKRLALPVVESAGKKIQGLYVSRVVASRHKESRVYLTLNGYRDDHFEGYVYVSEDHGTTWKRIGSDLPLEPVNVIKEDPKNAGTLYVGTDGGAYASMDQGKTFFQFTNGIPVSVPVHDIVIQERENEIVLGTHGRSIYIGKLDQVQKMVEKKSDQPTKGSPSFQVPDGRRIPIQSQSCDGSHRLGGNMRYLSEILSGVNVRDMHFDHRGFNGCYRITNGY